VARRAAQKLERVIVRRADRIVFTTRTNRDEFGAFYGAASAAKFHVIRNGCDHADFDGLTPLPRDERFTILHAGSLYGGRKPTAFFRALAALHRRGIIAPESFCFRQIGRVGLAGFDMRAESARLGLDAMVDIIAEEGELAELVRATGCGLAVLPHDDEGIERAVEMMLRTPARTAAEPRADLFDGRLRTRELAAVIEQACQSACARPRAYEVTPK
jgi:hypothetical protein